MFVKPPCIECEYREEVFEGFGCEDRFTKWLLTKSHKNFVGKRDFIYLHIFSRF